MPKIILFDPQFSSIEPLGLELHKEISAISSLLGDDEIEHVRNIAVGISQAATGDVESVAAEMVRSYLEDITAAFERVGLGDARSDKFALSFMSYMSWLSAAGKIDPGPAWKHSTGIASSAYAGLTAKAHTTGDSWPPVKMQRKLMSVPAPADLLAPGAQRDPRDPLLRLAQLFDGNDCDLLHLEGDIEVRTAAGQINGARVIAYCTDATQMGGALGAAGSRRIIEAIELAVRARCPVIGVWQSGGAKLADGVESMDAVGRMFTAMTRASGRVPQISVVVGPAAGAAAYGPALTDVIIMAPAGRVFITGPDVVKIVTGEQIDMEGLGGPEAHSRRSGVAYITADSETDAYLRARRLVTFFTRPGLLGLDRLPDGQDLRALLPASARRAYDVRPLVRAILDTDSDGTGDGEHYADSMSCSPGGRQISSSA